MKLQQMFKSARVYAINPSEFDKYDVESHLFRMPGPLEWSTAGWVDGGLLFPAPGMTFLTLAIAERILPMGVVNRVVAERATEFAKESAERHGAKTRAVSAKMRREIKAKVIDELLPGALVKVAHVHGYIDYGRNILVVGTGSAKVADTFVKLVRESIEGAKVRLFDSEMSLHANLRDLHHLTLLDEGEGPLFGDDFNLERLDGATAKFRGEPNTSDAVHDLLKDGAIITAARIIVNGESGPLVSSFIEAGARDQLVFKSIKFEELAHIEAGNDETEHETAEAENQATMLINASLFGRHWDSVAKAFNLKPQE